MPGIAGNRDPSNPSVGGFPFLSYRFLANRSRFRWAGWMSAAVFRLERIETLDKRR